MAQARRQGLEIGTQFGRGIAGLTVGGARLDESKGGIIFGFMATRHVFGPLALQGELNLVVKGGRSTGEMAGEPIRFDLDLTYMEVPVFAVLHSPRIAEVVGFQAFAGGSLEPLVGCEVEVVDSPGGARPDCRDLITSLDLGLTAGVGLDVFLEGLTIRLDLRRTDGQRQVNREGNTPVRNRTTVLSVGLMLF
ncbi:MAG: porin family protein [Gemmatimonadales bacterium]